MKDYKFHIEGFLTRDNVLLFQDWLLFLAKGRLDITGQTSSGDTWRLNLKSNESINISFISNKKAIEIQAPNEISTFVVELSKEAFQKFQKQSPTPGSWWKVIFHSKQNTMDQNSFLHMFRHLETFAIGSEKLRMGRAAHLQINYETGENFAPFPKLSIKVVFISPGAAGGPFSRLQAERTIPVINAVLSSCFGSPLMPGAAFFPAKDDELETVLQEIHSDKTPELGFKGLPIGSILQACHSSGAGELADRLIGAMMAYEAGMLQRTDHSTLLFFVSAIEALTVPNLKSAKKERLSKRFSDFLELLCSEEVEKVMAHPNFEQAFGKISSKKKFASELYNLRSQPVHTGHFGNYSGMLVDDQSLKVALVNDIVTGAIAALIRCPVTLLCGHPELDPSLTIRLKPGQHQHLKAMAKEHSKSAEEFVKYLVLESLSKQTRLLRGR